MEFYKEINKGLVMQNQNLRIQNSALQKEVICLRNELMDEHARRVIGEKKFKSLLIDNFRKTMVALEPNSNLLELLKIQDDVSSGDKCDGSYGGAVTARCTEKLRNSEILEELRRSNSLQRRSSIMASPTRRSSGGISSANKISLPPVLSQDLTYESDKLEKTESDMSLTLGNKTDETLDYSEEGNDCGIIDNNNSDKEEVEKTDEDYDDDDDEEEDEEKERESTPINIQNLSYISEEELQSKELSEKELLLEDADSNDHEELQQDEENIKLTLKYSNKQSGLDTLRPPTLLKAKKVRVKVARARNRSPLHDSSNYSLNDSVENEPELPQRNNVVVRRGRRRSCDDVSDNSIEKVRNINSQLEDQIDTTQEFRVTISKEQPTIDLGTTINSFKGLSIAPCSTPNFLEEFEDEEESNDEQSTRTRLKRSCKPKTLGEPSLRNKLRNETQTALSRRSRRRRK